MKKRIVISFTTILIVSLLACKNEPQVRDQATENAVVQAAEDYATRSIAEGKAVTISQDSIKLDNGKVFTLVPAGDPETSVIFLVRNAEPMEGKTALSDVGRARAGYLAQVLGKVGFSQAYTDKSNTSLQTGMMTAQANSCDVGFFQPEMASTMMSTLVHNFKGKRVFVVATLESLPGMLAEISGDTRYKVPADEFDNIFIATVKELGKGEILHIKY